MTLKCQLSSSPPGFEVVSLNWMDRQHSTFYNAISQRQNSEFQPSESINISLNKKQSSFEDEPQTLVFKSHLDLYNDSRFVKTKNRSKERIKKWEEAYNCEQNGHCNCKDIYESEKIEKNNRVKTAKNVVFADELGKDLFKIKITSESSDTPPEFDKKFQEKIEKTILENSFHQISLKNENIELNLLNFTNPQTDLLSLHKKVEELGLALSSISYEKMSVKGNTETRSNLPLDSVLAVRYTFDKWKSMKDVQGVCLSKDDNHTHHFYSFEIGISSINYPIDVEFAIYLKTSASDIWDNNNQLNYRVCIKDNSPAVSPSCIQEPYTFPQHQFFFPQDYDGDFYGDW